jgi:TM2 domain-containing membrane protein YozV
MIYNCPHCQQKFDIPESGRYCCSSCNQEFEVTIPKTPDLVKVSVPEPIEPEQQENVCPFCKLSIPAGARKCGHCGEWVNAADKNVQKVNRNVYLLLSFLFGHFGVHQFYAGNATIGIGFFLFTILGICFGIAAQHVAGFAIVAIFGLLQFVIALFDKVGIDTEQPKEKRKDTLSDKILLWFMYSIIVILVGTIIVVNCQ